MQYFLEYKTEIEGFWMMKNKKITVGVSGGIAAYKIAELVRLLVKEGAETRVAMTRNATRFVAPLTFEALSGNRVIRDMWDGAGDSIDHINWGQEADLVILAPATANLIAKLTHGIADDFLSTMLLAATAKMLVCPAMNSRMYQHPTVQQNLQQLRDRGLALMQPVEGPLACGSEGPGRLPEPEEILQQAAVMLAEPDLAGLKILVTAGPTAEPIDPVRYLSNRSTGKMGYALARAAIRRGATVSLVSGPTNLNPPSGATFFSVRTAEEMRQAVFENRAGMDIIIKAAAVSDYRPQTYTEQKIKKEPGSLSLDLVRTADILAELGKTKPQESFLLVGFAAETENLLDYAQEKMRSKNVDIIVANDISAADTGFESDTNRIKMIFRDGRIEDSPLLSKDAVADLILDRLLALTKGAK